MGAAHQHGNVYICNKPARCAHVPQKYNNKKKKTPRRYHLTHIKMAFIQKTGNNKCWQGGREKGTLVHCWWECKLVQPLWRTVQRFLKKLKIELSYNQAIPQLGIYLKERKSVYQRDICSPIFVAALFTTAKIWRQPKCPSTDKWIKTIWYTYAMEYYSVLKKYIRFCHLQQHKQNYRSLY